MDKNKFIGDFFRSHYELLFSYTYKLVRNWHDAEDILCNFFSFVLPKLIEKYPHSTNDFKQLIPLAKVILGRDIKDFFRGQKRIENWRKNKICIDPIHTLYQKIEDKEFVKFTLDEIVKRADLSPLESEMLHFILLGFNIDEICAAMKVSKQEAYNIRTTLMRKLRSVVKEKG